MLAKGQVVLIVPTLRVGMPLGRSAFQPLLAVLSNMVVTRSVTGCIPTQSVRTIKVRLESVRADRSHAPAWECLKGHSAFQPLLAVLSNMVVTRSVTGCIPTQNVGTIKLLPLASSRAGSLPQGNALHMWERACSRKRPIKHRKNQRSQHLRATESKHFLASPGFGAVLP